MSSGSFFRRPAVLLALSLGALAVVVSVLGSLAGGSRAGLKAIALASPRGAETYGSFSPDGKRLAYSVRRVGDGESKEESFDLFVRDLPYGHRWQMGGGTGSDVGAAWSPDGSSVAFLRVGEEGKGECMTIPADGGEAKKVADCGGVSEGGQFLPAVAWTPDAKSLVIALAGEKGSTSLAAVAAAGGEPKRITEPSATQMDSTPAVSPDGKMLAFVRSSKGDDAGADLFVCELTPCKPQQITFDAQPIRGIAWMADSRTLVYSGRRLDRWRLWRLASTGGDPRDVGVPGRQAQFPAIAPAGGRLVYTESPSVSAIWRAPLNGAGDAAPGVALIRSSGREWSPSYSPDGSKIATLSDQSEADEIWVSGADGGNRVQITHFKGKLRPLRARWSPDGRTLCFEARATGVPEIDCVAAAGGEPKRIVLDGSSPSWSQDGKSIYYQARNQIWKVGADGKNPRQITDREGNREGPGMMRFWPEESADGKWVYYRRWGSMFRVPADGGKEEEAFQLDMGWGPTQFAAKGIYYTEWNRAQRRQVVTFYDFASRQTTVVFRGGGDMSGFAISPDGKAILYPRVDRSATNLMLVEGFK